MKERKPDRKTGIAALMLHPVGTNPYDRRFRLGQLANPWCSGDGRVKALLAWRDGRGLPEGCVAWSESERLAITDKNDVDWGHLDFRYPRPN